jgi:hypothetical protein
LPASPPLSASPDTLTFNPVPGVACAKFADAVVLSICTSSPLITPANVPLEVSDAIVLPSSTLSAAPRLPMDRALGKIEAVIPAGISSS